MVASTTTLQLSASSKVSIVKAACHQSTVQIWVFKFTKVQFVRIYFALVGESTTHAFSIPSNEHELILL